MAEEGSLLPCAFRQVRLGRTFCARAIEEFDREVWPETCGRCPVPAWLEEGICRHLDIGVRIGRRGTQEGPEVLTACRHFRVRLDGLDRCRTCPEFSRWEGKEESQGEEKRSAVHRMLASTPPDLLAQAVEEALDRRVAEEHPRWMPGCFRLGVAQCIRSPQWMANWVLVVPPSSMRPADAYRALVEGVLRQGELQPIFFLGPLKDIDALCVLCLAVQQAPHLVIDLSEWDAAALFAMGLGGALGRQLLLVRAQDSTPPFLPQGLPVSTYGSGEDLAFLLARGLGIRLPKPEAPPTEQEERTPPTPPPKAEKHAPPAGEEAAPST